MEFFFAALYTVGKMKTKNTFVIGICVFFGLLAFLGVTRAWTNPAVAPPGGTPAIYYSGGNIGIGGPSSGAKLEVAGQIKITGGSPAAGKVLTSDGAGLATWQAPASGQAFPVGSVFLSIVSTNPATLLGYGTWVQISQGRALVGQNPSDADWDTPEETRGEKTHTLTISEMPSHTHIQDPHTHTPYINHGNSGTTRIRGGGPDDMSYNGSMSNTTATNQYTGGNQPHNNIQPSFVIYVWKRTG